MDTDVTELDHRDEHGKLVVIGIRYRRLGRTEQTTVNATSMFMPRLRSDRPAPVPPNSKNLGFISQFVEIPQDVVFTVEYSIRAAQIAVYQLLDVKRAIPAVTPHDRAFGTRLEAAIKAFE